MQTGQQSLRDHIWWVDDRGRWRQFGDDYAARNPYCALARGTERRDVPFTEYGMVRVTELAQLVDIQWDVAGVSDAALDAVCQYLRCIPHAAFGVTIALRFYYGAWNTEIFRDTAVAVARIRRTRRFAETAPFDGFLSVEQDLCDASLARQDEALRACLDLWQRTGGEMWFDGLPELGPIMSRLLLFTPDDHGERMIYEYAGPRSLTAQVLGRSWHLSSLGCDAADGMTDRPTGERMCASYMPVLASGEPRIDHIRAIVRQGDDDPVWLAYQRILLPWTEPGGRPYLMCLAHRTQDLDIPFMAA